MGHLFLILAIYLTIRQIKEKSVDLCIMLVVWMLEGGAPTLQVCDIPSLHLAEVGQDKNRVVGRDTGIDVWDHFCQGCQRQI